MNLRFDDRPIACSPFCLLTRYLTFQQLVALREAGIKFYVREVEFPHARPVVR